MNALLGLIPNNNVNNNNLNKSYLNTSNNNITNIVEDGYAIGKCQMHPKHLGKDY